MTDELPEQTAITAPTQVVERFLFAIRDKDYDTMRALLDDDVIYHNVGFSPIRGGDRTVTFLRRGLSRPGVGFDVKIHRIAADGTSVLNERTDAVEVGALRFQFWICGVFEVRDGRITLWRDYFDFFDIIKSAVRAVVSLAVPSLKPAF